MPYIQEADRQRLDELVDEIGRTHRWVQWRAGRRFTVGELNYLITNLILEFLPNEPHYEDYNGVMGVLEGVKMELYRRRIAPYEDKKIAENGDVY